MGGRHGRGVVGRFLSAYGNVMLRGERWARVAAWAAVLALAGTLAWCGWLASPAAPRHVPTSVIETQLRDGNVAELHVCLDDGSVSGTFRHGVGGVRRFEGFVPLGSQAFQGLYMGGGVEYDLGKPNALVSLLRELAPTVATVGTLLAAAAYLARTGALGPVTGRGEGGSVRADRPDVTFDDVLGLPEATEEVAELVTFLRDRDAYDAAHARVPRGVLLQGPPGTGKTLLARALAGEAGVPFYATSGSDFIEKYVGVGASRLRSLFAEARRDQPCIVFIDEIDAIGGDRDAAGDGDPEHMRTMNQLLTEMDGFAAGDRVIVIAATNRGDRLDPALVRPGRFDRVITVGEPTLEGREEILRHYAEGRPFEGRVDFARLARRTCGFSGAQLEGLMNQAATLAARRAIADGESPAVTEADLDEGLARVIGGPAMRSRVMSEGERRQVAFHEAGHAVVQYVLPGCDPVQRISMVSRSVGGRVAMGYVQTYSERDRYVETADAVRDEMAALLAGRCAEEAFCGVETTGASDDLARASSLAYRMAAEFAFRDPDGSRTLRTGGGTPSGQARLDALDAAAERALAAQWDRASAVLSENAAAVEAIAEALLEREQVDGDEIGDIIASATGRAADGEDAAGDAADDEGGTA